MVIKIFVVQDSDEFEDGYHVLDILDLDMKAYTHFKESLEDDSWLDNVSPLIMEELDESVCTICDEILKTSLSGVNLFVYEDDLEIFEEKLESELNLRASSAKIETQEDGAYVLNLKLSYLKGVRSYISFSTFKPVNALDPRVLKDVCDNPDRPGA